MRQYFLIFSLLANLLFAFVFFLFVQRSGGLRYLRYRLGHNQSALYAHRRQLFEKMPASPGAVIFVGDSQTEQCEWREWMALPDTLRLLNRGITADHVSGVLERLPEILRHRPASVFLMIGINDLLFGKSPADILSVYDRIIKTMRQQSPHTRLVVLTLPPVNNQIKNIGLPNGTVRQLNAALALLAQGNGLLLLDLYGPLSDGNGQLDARFTEDGLHLNGEGYEVWKRLVQEALR